MELVKSPKTIIATKEEARVLMKRNFKTNKQIYGFYNSNFDRIIINEDLMVVPIYDRQVHRGHSVFDTVDVIQNRLVLLDEHLNRLKTSCDLVKIPLPMPIQTMKEKIIDLASFCISQNNLEKADFYIRYWVSSGGDNFGILPSGNSRFYIVAFPGNKKTNNQQLVKEYSITDIEAKQGILALSKTTNYLVNALMAMEAHRKGGFLGIMTTKERIVLEAPVMNVGFVWKNGDFVTATFKRTLRGTTLIECMDFIREVLVKKGIVKDVIQKDFTLEDVYENAVEMMIIGGNMIIPVGVFDDRIISKEIGPIAKLLQENYLKRVLEKAEKVPLNRYKKNIPNPKL